MGKKGGCNQKRIDVYKKIEEIVNIIIGIYPMARLFKDKIMAKIKKVPESTLENILFEIKIVLDEK